ncbi:membrane protein [Geobacillus stearothermophilus]|nr:membrane protein [Geobacillus stearothermophilus]
MIQDGIVYLSVLLAFAALIALAEQKSQSKLFKAVPGIIFIYIGGALMQTIGVFGTSESIDQTYSTVRSVLLPAMLILMLLHCDLRKIIKMGPKILLTFFAASLTIILGFTITYVLFKGLYAEGTWKAFAALSGSWTGGSANMVALQSILSVPENIFGYALIMDTVNYSIWVMFMFWLVPFADRFNRWTKANTVTIPAVNDQIAATNENRSANIGFTELMMIIGFSLLLSTICTKIGNTLPEIGSVFNASTWAVVIASIIGMVLAMTKVADIPGTNEVSKVMLYTIIALIASKADFSQLFQAPIYIVSGFMILLIHAVLMLVLAKLFKLDLFTMGVASLANIGGVASAPILAGAYHQSLIPVGILMALLGNLLGTYYGLLTAHILSSL